MYANPLTRGLEKANRFYLIQNPKHIKNKGGFFKMDKKVIIGIIVAIVVVALAGYFLLTSGNTTLVAEDLQVIAPGNYSASSDFSAAAGDVNVSFVPQKGTSNKEFVNKFFKAVMANGKNAGYENITNKSINGTEAYEFAAHPGNLKNVSTEREATAEGEAWTTYPPEFAAPFEGNVDHFRSVYYVKDDKVYVLTFTTGNASTNLYTPEIDGIINSIAPVQK